MVTNYEYEDWFYTGSHRKCLLFVEQDADVEIDAGQPPIVSLPSGETPIVITNEDILKERFELQENFNTAENWAFGSVEPSCVSIDIRQTDAIPILKGMTFRLYFLFDDNSSTLLYVGTYVFDTDELSEDSKSRTISGYDMIQSIRDLDVIDFYRGLFAAHEEPDPEDESQTIWVPAKEKIKVKDARDALFSYLIMFEDIPIIQENVELPNDNFEFAFDVDTEALSAGQLLEDLCEINGRYGHLSRELSTFQFPLLPEIKNVQVFKYIRVERYDESGIQIGNEIRIHGMKKGLYETNSIGRLRVYNRDDVLLASYDDGWKRHFSVYNIYDNILIDNITKSKTTKSALKTMMKNIYDSIRYRKYVPFEAKAPADLCREAGDRITLYLDIDLQNEDENRSYKTLIFKRRISGIQNMIDTYSAEGDRNLPNFGDYSKSGGYSAKRSGSGFGTSKEQKEGTDGDFTLEGMTSNDLRLYLKNVGIQTLEEPTDVTAEVEIVNDAIQVALKWTDPVDIVTNTPYPASWEGTVVVRKEGSAPKHRWDGVVKVKQSTTRDEFKEDAFIDTGVEPNKVYYYGFYPYFTQLDDDLKIRHYTWTKIVKVSTENPISKPEITNLLVNGGTTVTVGYTIPSLSIGSYEYCKLVGKKNSIPESSEDGDKIVNIDPTLTSINVEGLDELSTYYFVIFIEDDQDNTASSEPKSCETGRDLGWRFINILGYDSCQVSVDLLDSFYDTDTTTPIYQTGGFSGEIINPIAQGYYGDEAYFGARCNSVDYSDGMRANGMMYYMETGASWNIIEQSIPTDGGLILALNVDGRCLIGTLAHSSNSASPYSRFTLIRKANGVNTDLYQALIKSEQFPDDWEQVVFDANVFEDTLGNSYQGTIVDTDCCAHGYVIRRYDDENIAFINQYMTGDMSDSEYFPTTKTEIYRNGDYYITILRDTFPGPGYPVGWKFGKDGEQEVLAFSVGGNGSYRSKLKVAIAINKKEHRGKFIFGTLSVGNFSGSVGPQSSGLDYKHTDINMYNWLTNSGMVQEE